MRKALIYELKRELLLYLLLNDSIRDKNILIVDKNIYEKDKQILDKLNMLKIVINQTPCQLKIKIIKKFFNNFIFLKNYLRIKKLVIRKKIDIFAINDLGIMKKYMKGLSINILEDGLVDYTPYLKKQKNKKEKIVQIIDFFFGIRERSSMFNSLENIKNIYLTGLTKVPVEISSKVKLIDLNKLWQTKLETEKIKILDIFGVSEKNFEILKKRKFLLLTQPLSEDKYITEKEKIDIYRKILKNYREEEITIKPHPREKTNYKEYFPNCYILEEKAPIELLILNGLKIKKAITLFSTAVFGLGKEVEIDFYGTEVHPNILKRFGSMDHIMKRNKFL